MSAYIPSLRILVVCSLLLITASATAQQGIREEPTCASNEVLVNHKCVPRNRLPFPPPVAGQTGEENPPIAAPRPDHPTIPRCKEGEELRDGKCVPKT